MISVALCTYNGGRFLREQLESLRSQTLLPSEVQVGDDGSTDDTLMIIEEFRASAPFPVHVTVNKQRLGYGENFIQTARRCSGKWIAFCDQDDIWKPHKLQRSAQQIGDGVSLVAHDADGNLLNLRAEKRNPPLSLSPRWFCLGFCQLFDRRILEYPRQALPWASVPDAHDVWVSFIAGMMGTIVWLDEQLAIYRRHETNVSLSLPELSGDDIGFIEAASRVAGDLGFTAASIRYERFADRLKKRAELKETRNPRTFFELLLSGAYGSGGYDRFGKRGLLRDMQTLVAGA